jgi:hypothetical protein
VNGEHAKQCRERHQVAHRERLIALFEQLRKDDFKGLSDGEANRRISELFERALVDRGFIDRSDCAAYHKIISYMKERKQGQAARYRELVNAEAHDHLDSFVGQLRERARSLKRTHADFQDVELLARILKPVIGAIEGYETFAKPKFTDPYALNELANTLQVTFHLGGIIGPMGKARARMASIRKKRSSKSQARDEDIAKSARVLRDRHPKWSVRRLAQEISKGIGLKRNTVEKKLSALAKAWITE